MMFAPLASALPHIKAGKLRAIGLASLKRTALIPDVPTIAEQGVREVRGGVVVRADGAGRHAEGRRSIGSAPGHTMLAAADVREKLAAHRHGGRGGPPAQLAATIQVETARWTEVVRKQHIKPE